ncbi:vacuolar iron transporter homolog 2-like [Mercurialis annua]|uniref:vacuolar iron transporter homolog 2-like n=1 Tax=Mercurialis annua TaxID=3986 RepID=UPI00215F9416|nr:vacuolar iron transporter homolog 2-like [Mercurialis annua]
MEEQKKIAEADARRSLERAQWVRAAILGASDGLLSTTSLMIGVGAAGVDGRSMVLSGLAGALAGACSMAVGEFVSVSTQRDIENTTLSATKPPTVDIIIIPRDKTSPFGRSPTKEDDNLLVITNPYKAAAASGVSFLLGSSVPLVSAIVVKEIETRIMVIMVVASAALALCGGVGAYLGGSPIRTSAARLVVGGWVSMAVTYGLLKMGSTVELE